MGKRVRIKVVNVDGVSNKETAVYARADEGAADYLKEKDSKKKMKAIDEAAKILTKAHFSSFIIRGVNPLVEGDDGEIIEPRPTGFTMVGMKDPFVKAMVSKQQEAFLTAQICYIVRDVSRLCGCTPGELMLKIFQVILSAEDEDENKEEEKSEQGTLFNLDDYKAGGDGKES